ncbi:DUF6193 family natural product biosynthesis protein [Streptomyces qinzhouensis]|uniref:Uncharacterized protein n=1 Tax=Streptomyces qinzhouensis TaxID=2599401 RepID=A0A5B8J974_9ACTN|nr:DUF6193 family natural product biosynthesis protein [Streptomyces qinzhouensis]QDY76944.1 hypothetical protein FQU76_10885 [Streptomyces qinzhouensis]
MLTADTVDEQWELVLGMDDQQVSAEMPRAAYARLEIRQLYPLVSHGVLSFSRCIRFPWLEDVGTIYPRGDGYWVRRVTDGATLGKPDTIEEAVELIVANLPPGTGPAIDGTAEDVARG